MIRTRLLSSAIVLATLAVAPAMAQSNNNIWCNNTSSSCNPCCYQRDPAALRPVPSTDKSADENIRILLDAAEQDQKDLRNKWFSSNKDLDSANEKVKNYKQMLRILG